MDLGLCVYGLFIGVFDDISSMFLHMFPRLLAYTGHRGYIYEKCLRERVRLARRMPEKEGEKSPLIGIMLGYTKKAKKKP